MAVTVSILVLSTDFLLLLFREQTKLARDRRKDSDETIWEETHATADLLLFCLLQSNRMAAVQTDPTAFFCHSKLAERPKIRKECDMSLNNCPSLSLIGGATQ